MKTITTYICTAAICLAIGFAIPQYLNHDSNVHNIEIDVVGKTAYELGDIAEFNVSIANAPKSLNKTTAWKVINNGTVVEHKKLSDTNIIFPVGIKPTKITVLAHLVYVDPKTKALANSDFFVKDVSVGEYSPNPPPFPPTPTPTPTPTPPVGPKDGKYKIAVMAYTNAMSLVKIGNPAVAAQAFVKGYKETADEIDKGKYPTLKDVYEGVKTNNTAELSKVGEVPDGWNGWEDVMKKYIASLHNSKQLPALSDHANLFREIADGLSYVK